jgi:hypothetical protein
LLDIVFGWGRCSVLGLSRERLDVSYSVWVLGAGAGGCGWPCGGLCFLCGLWSLCSFFGLDCVGCGASMVWTMRLSVHDSTVFVIVTTNQDSTSSRLCPDTSICGYFYGTSMGHYTWYFAPCYKLSPGDFQGRPELQPLAGGRGGRCSLQASHP